MKKSSMFTLLMLIISVAIIFTGKIYQEYQLKDMMISVDLNEDNKENGTQEVINEEYSEFYEMLINDKVSNITLLGDSITAGVGIPSHSTPPENQVIFYNGEEEFKESALTTKSWANDLRNYVNQPKFGDITFVNKGIGGKSGSWALENIDYLLEDKEDVVFVMYGTNDRTHGSLEDYRTNITELLETVDERSNYMVVMSPPPSANDYYEFYFSPEDIDSVLKEVSEDKGYNFISHFDGINNYLQENPDAEYSDLMQTEGAHPIELGYKVMWNTIKTELELE
ncbi:SGNH/GDSL hydrolase family protein [Jeotgalibaca porci]|uniref:SGNH/GDSL hydrolase family protein n=1 Tax=Jeotgalibaca porci TaxID=1868793 RepID=UPI00359FC3A4